MIAFLKTIPRPVVHLLISAFLLLVALFLVAEVVLFFVSAFFYKIDYPAYCWFFTSLMCALAFNLVFGACFALIRGYRSIGQ